MGRRDRIWLEMSTTDEEEMIRLSNLCQKKNIETLEAPVTGGQHRAESGNISILVSGKKKTFNKAFNLLSNIGHNILYCGKIGNASTLKVVTNYLASINLLSLGEALMVCTKYGLDLKTSYHGIAISSGNSFVHDTESQLILNVSYNVGLSMDIACTDGDFFHKVQNKIATVLAVKPLGRFGALQIKNNSVQSFLEKPIGDNGRVNGGFFVLNKKIFKYLNKKNLI